MKGFLNARAKVGGCEGRRGRVRVRRSQGAKVEVHGHGHGREGAEAKEMGLRSNGEGERKGKCFLGIFGVPTGKNHLFLKWMVCSFRNSLQFYRSTKQ